jgi:site-specific DNA-methyltransferase (adenine-specific)
MLELNRIYNMDCVEGMKLLDDESIDCVITSPPYDNLRNYDGECEWNSDKFRQVADQIARVLKTGGVIVWVVGDATVNGSETGTSFRQALYFMETGLNLHDTMIYQKEIPTWNITSKRYRQHFEYMFVFSKGKCKTFNPIEDVKVKNMTPRKCKSNRTGESKYDWYVPKKEYTVRGNIWFYPVGGGCTKDKIAYLHPAIFPEQLVEDHIITWTNTGDVILDPFMGSGTTAKMALLNNRNYIGFETSEKYCKISNERLGEIILQKSKELF